MLPCLHRILGTPDEEFDDLLVKIATRALRGETPGEWDTGRGAITERDLKPIIAEPLWEKQLQLWRLLRRRT